MKKFLAGSAFICLCYAIWVVVSIYFLPPVTDLKERKTSVSIQVKDWNGEYHPFVLGPKNRYWTPSASIPPEMKWAVIVAEDANFYKHEGVDVKALKDAIKYDLEKKSMAKGASTITQQTAKNIFLSREKTLTRKFKELYLALRMEQELTKGRIIELYLNLVELGPMVYGVGHASHYYFGKPASMMTPRESAFLAAMLPGPRVAYNPYRNIEKVLRRSDTILKLLKAKRVISEEEYNLAMATSPNINGLQRRVDASIAKPVELFTNNSTASAPLQKQEGGNGSEPGAEPQSPVKKIDADGGVKEQ